MSCETYCSTRGCVRLFAWRFWRDIPVCMTTVYHSSINCHKTWWRPLMTTGQIRPSRADKTTITWASRGLGLNINHGVDGRAKDLCCDYCIGVVQCTMWDCPISFLATCIYAKLLTNDVIFCLVILTAIGCQWAHCCPRLSHHRQASYSAR